VKFSQPMTVVKELFIACVWRYMSHVWHLWPVA